MRTCSVFAPEGIREVTDGDDIAAIIADALFSEGETLRSGDVVAVAHKIVSKSEGRTVHISEIKPGMEALSHAQVTGMDARLLQVILNESSEVLHASRPFICRHRLGFVCANAGVDCSNSVPDTVVLLPLDPDASAEAIRAGLEGRYGVPVGVLVCDTHGRALREGVTGIAIGASGIAALRHYAGQKDRRGRAMQTSVEALADELAATATLLMGQANESRPVVIIRGLDVSGEGGARPLVRPKERDIFIKNYNRSCNHVD